LEASLLLLRLFARAVARTYKHGGCEELVSMTAVIWEMVGLFMFLHSVNLDMKTNPIFESILMETDPIGCLYLIFFVLFI